MPLFMTISGFFYANKKSFVDILSSRFTKLLLPALCWSLICCILAYLIPINIGGAFYVNVFWFLKSAFLCSIIYAIVAHNRILLILSLVTSQFISIYQFWYMYPFFVLGAYIKNNFDIFQQNIAKILLICGSMFLLMLVFWDSTFWQYNLIYTNNNETIKTLNYIYIRVYRLLIGILGSVSFIALFRYLAQHIKQTIVGDKICECGRHTLGIYILQTFILELILRRCLNFDNYNFYVFNVIIAPIISTFVLIFCLLLIKIIHHSKWASRFLLGE